MDRRQREQARLACQIGIGLMAGFFGIVPSVSAAPVQDAASSMKAGDFKVDQTQKTAQGGMLTAVTSTTQNNVVPWKDFSVGTKEKVQFDGGATTGDAAHNYLNVVTGNNPSEIAGAIEGGKNVYIVNQHGVLFDDGATVNVGNLYVSTANPEAITAAAMNAYKENGTSPLANTANAVAGDVTNLGTIEASNVVIQGRNIKFIDRDDVKANVVDFQAMETASLGQRVSKIVETGASTPAGIKKLSKSAANVGQRTVFRSETTLNETGAIEDLTDFLAISKITDMSKNYDLKADIDLNNAEYTPIGASSAYEGTFDGHFHRVSNIKVSSGTYGGLFGYTSGATIKNVGVKSGSVTATYAGGIVGEADNTTLLNVFNEGVTVNPADIRNHRYYAGGIVGYAIGGSINSAYNTGNYRQTGGGIIGYGTNANITNAYNGDAAKEINNGVLISAGSGGTVNYSYTYGSTIVNTKNVPDMKASANVTDASSYVNAANYSGWVNGGHLSTSGNDDTPWRIYEGLSHPLLRAFLRRGSSSPVTVNYTYSMGDLSGTNNGSDLTSLNSLTYNHSPLQITDITYTNDDLGTIDSNTSLIQKSNMTVTINNGTETFTPAGTYYFYSTDQHGYDLVGNTITVNQREVSLTNALNGSVTKVYDGTNSVDKAALESALNSSTDSDTGIIAGDTTATIVFSSTSNPPGTFDGVNAGKHTVTVTSGGLTLSQPTYNNYKLTGDSTLAFSEDHPGVFTNATITQAKLQIAIIDGINLTRDYNGKNNSAVEDGVRVKDKATGETVFSLTGKQSQNGTTDDVYISVDADTGDYADATTTNGTTTYAKTGKAGDHAVIYEGIKLGGKQATNYKLVDTSGNVIYQVQTNGVGQDVNTSGGTFVTSGTINRKTISSSSFNLPNNETAEKDYDGNEYLAKAEGKVLTSDDIVSGDTVNFTVGSDGTSAWFSKGGTAVSDAGKNYDISYKVNVTGNDAENYKLDSTDLASGTAATVTGAKGTGTIHPRILTMKLGQNANSDKDYDGDEFVKANHNGAKEKAIQLSDAYVTYADGTTDAHKLLDTDDVAFDITGEYQTTGKTGTTTAKKDVLDANKDGIGEAKNIIYTVKLTGDKAANYAFVSRDNDSANVGQSLTGATGIISPKTLTASINTTLAKTFDWGTKTGQYESDTLTADKLTLDGLVSDADKSAVLTQSVLDTLNGNGDYGLGTGSAFKADEHAGDKTVRFTGLTSGSTNYKFADSTLEGSGKIAKREIDNLTVDMAPVTKVYDGKTTVATTDDGQNVAKSAKDYITSVKTSIQTKDGSNVEHTLDASIYTVADADGAYYITEGGTATKDVLTATKARFLLNFDGTAGNRDFTIADKLKTNGFFQQDTTASITPRTVYASVTHTEPFEKTYDATTAVYDAKTKTGITAGSDSVTIDGLLGDDAAKNASYGVFKDKNVAYVNDTDTIATKDVDYTLSLGDKTTQGNYAVYNLADKDKADKTALAYDTAGVLTGKGKITPADLTVDFATVSKTYDGNTDVIGTEAEKTMAATLTGLLTPTGGTKDDVSVSIVTTGNRAPKFEDANKGTDKNVTYAYQLSGNDLRNYHLTTLTDAAGTNSTKAGTYTQVVGGNTIGALRLDADTDIVVDWGTVQKTYDGGTNVAYDHTDTNTYFDSDDVVKNADGTTTKAASRSASDFVHSITMGLLPVSYQIDDTNASYGAAGAGSQTATFKFDIAKSVLDNYEIGTGVKSLTKNSDGSGVLTVSTPGTITQKYLKTTFNDSLGGNATDATKAAGLMTKVYNGLTDVVTNSQSNPAGTALNGTDAMTKKLTYAGVVKDADNSGLTEVSGVYNSPNVEDAKNVVYTVDLKNGNYQFAADSAATSSAAAQMQYTGSGEITQKELALDVKKDTFNRIYDNTSNLDFATAKGDTSRITVDGLVNGETSSLALDSLDGAYRKNVDGTMQDNGDVEGKAGSPEEYKALQLRNIQAAFTNGTLTKSDGTAATKGNYTIADTQDFDADTEAGKITRLQIQQKDVVPTWLAYPREYNGESTITDPGKALALRITDVTKSDGSGTIHLTKPVDVTYTGEAYFTKNGGTTHQANVGKDLGYEVTITGVTPESMNNFSMTDMADLTKNPWNGSYYSKNDNSYLGTITPRLLTVEATSNDFDKVYDSENTVRDASSKFTWNRDNVVPEDQGKVSVKIDDTNVFYNTAGTTNPTGRTHSADAEKDKVISIGAIIEGDAEVTKNYTLVLGTGDEATKVVSQQEVLAKDADGNTVTGTISPKALKLAVADGVRFDKEYDTTSDVLQDQLKNVTFSGLVTREDGTQEVLTPDNNSLSGHYVTGKAATADDEQSGVNWNAKTNAADDWGISITGGKDALAKATSTNGAKASNYIISDSDAQLYFQQAAKRGKIQPATLNLANLTPTWDTTRKTYDAMTDIADADGKTAKDILSFKVTSYTANNTAYDIEDAKQPTVSYTLGSAAYDNKNVGQDHQLNYTVKSFDGLKNADGSDNHNYSLTNLAANARYTSNAENVITPKLLKAHLAKTTDVDKTYDGTTDVKNAESNLVIDQGILSNETDKVTFGLDSSAYDDENASEKANDRTLTYTVKLDGNTNGNYTLDLDNHAEAGDATETADLTATGTINKRKVYATFADGKGTGIDKEYGAYGGKTNVLDTVRKDVVLKALDISAETGIVAKDEGKVALDNAAISMAYEDGNVHRAGADQTGALEAQNVNFTEIALTSTDETANPTDNYELYLLNGTKETSADGGTLKGSGTISPKTVHATLDTSADIEKTYDATTNLADSNLATMKDSITLTDADLIDEDSGGAKDVLGFSVAGGSYASEDSNAKLEGLGTLGAGERQGVNYNVSWTNRNYALDFQPADAVTVAANGVKDATFQTKQGVIDQRHLQAEVVNNNTSKIYDGTLALDTLDNNGNATTNTPDELVSFKIGKDIGLTGNPNDDVANATTAAYLEKNVGTPDIRYSLALTGSDAANYVFDDQIDGKAAIDGAGTITKRTLKLQLKDGARLDKTYDGAADVLLSDDTIAQKFEFTNLANGESLTVGTGLSGAYRTTNGEGAADVNWQNGAKDKNLTITGGAQAFQNADSADGTADLKNYQFDTASNTLTYDVDASGTGRGKITPARLTLDNLQENWTAATKTYDGGTSVTDPEKYLTLTVKDFTANGETYTTDSKAQPVVTYTIQKDGATYDDKNVGKDHVLTYTLSDFGDVTDTDGTVNHNFTAEDLATPKAFQSAADNTITPKLLTATLKSATDIDKVYDGTADVLNPADNFVVDGLVTGETDPVTFAITGTYNDKNASKTANDKQVTYAIELSGNTHGNYTMDLAAHPDAGLATESATASATGTISPRKIYVDLASGTGTGIDKVYGTTYEKTVAADGYDAAKREADPTHRTDVVIVDNTANDAASGIVDGEVTLDTDSIALTYADGDVHRDTNGNLETQEVTYSNIHVKNTDAADDEASNYEIALYGGKQSLTGTGTITPATVTVDVDNAEEISKEYDGTAALTAENIAAVKANVTADAADMMLGESVNALGLTVTPGDAYTYAGAANIHTNKRLGIDDGALGLDYTLAWTNGNYQLALNPTSPDAAHPMTVHTNDNVSKTATLSTVQGTITPRELAITSIADIEKTYDGTTAVDADDLDQYANLTFDRLLDQDKTTNTFATATATYYNEDNTAEDANAGVAGDTARDSTALRGHKVRYTDIQLANDDYELADDGYTANGYALGNGTIKRRTLTFTSDPKTITFLGDGTSTGTVTGWTGVAGDTDWEAYTADSSIAHWNGLPGANKKVGTNPLYGWYRYGTASESQAAAAQAAADADSALATGLNAAGGSLTASPSVWASISDDTGLATDGTYLYRNSGNYGLNYTMTQDAANKTQLTVEYPTIPDSIEKEAVPEKTFKPNHTAYSNASHDEDASKVTRTPQAAIEYAGSTTSVSASGETTDTGIDVDDSESKNAIASLEDAGSAVNLSSTLELTNDGTETSYTSNGTSGAGGIASAAIVTEDGTMLFENTGVADVADVAGMTDSTDAVETATVADDTETASRAASAAIETVDDTTEEEELFGTRTSSSASESEEADASIESEAEGVNIAS